MNHSQRRNCGMEGARPSSTPIEGPALENDAVEGNAAPAERRRCGGKSAASRRGRVERRESEEQATYLYLTPGYPKGEERKGSRERALWSRTEKTQQKKSFNDLLSLELGSE